MDKTLNMQIVSRSQFGEVLNHFNLPKIVVEVGVAEGRFSTEMFAWGLDKLYLVDIWENMPFIEGCGSFDNDWHNKNYEEVKSRFFGNDKVVLLKGFSHKVADQVPDESVGMVYVDGDHMYKGVKSDIYTWMPKLVKSGIMAFHDYWNPTYGVQHAAKEYADANGIAINMIMEGNKIENVGAWIQKP